MRKKFFITLITLLLFPAFVAQAKQEIEDYKIEIKINTNGDLMVKEEIFYNFGDNERHGIYRNIPVKYKARGGNYNLRLSDITVKDEQGNDLLFTVAGKGRYKVIKIGNPDKTIKGKKKYIISYHIKRAINFFPDHDELYWDAIGAEWNIDIMQARANIVLPVIINEDDLQTKCFAGAKTSNKECLSKRYIYTGKKKVREVVFTTDRLHPKEGMTLVIGLPKGIIHKPSLIAAFFDFIYDNWIVALPVLTFFILLYLWLKWGRDPRGRKTIIARFGPPDNLTPAEVGVIIDEKAHQKDISAEIVYLAVLGYIKIQKLPKSGFIFKSSDYVLVKLKDEGSLKNDFDKKLMSALFRSKHIDITLKSLIKTFKKQEKNKTEAEALSWILKKAYGLTEIKDNESIKVPPESLGAVKLSELKDNFYRDLAEIKKKIYNTTVEKGYFRSNPNKKRNLYLGLGAAIVMAGFFVGGFFGFWGVASMLVSGALVMIFSFLMPQKTKAGVLAREHILGLKEYLRVAEKDRLKFHNAPEKNPKHFEYLLPYAMVLGVEKEWAKQFADIYKNQQPTWYNDPGMAAFNALSLSEGLRGFGAKANSVLASSPSSASGGGSGFSGGGVGGGFGGGGGGSW